MHVKSLQVFISCFATLLWNKDLDKIRMVSSFQKLIRGKSSCSFTLTFYLEWALILLYSKAKTLLAVHQNCFMSRWIKNEQQSKHKTKSPLLFSRVWHRPKLATEIVSLCILKWWKKYVLYVLRYDLVQYKKSWQINNFLAKSQTGKCY